MCVRPMQYASENVYKQAAMAGPESGPHTSWTSAGLNKKVRISTSLNKAESN